MKLLHAHLQYVCNIASKISNDILKTLGEVDFIKNMLYQPLLNMYRGQECSKLKKMCKSIKNDF